MDFKSIDRWLLKNFRRITSSDSFFPEIDGLRFLAITLVILYHSNIYIIGKAPGLKPLSENAWFYTNILRPMFSAGHQGVMLFFVISGFILSFPFVRAQLGIGQKPSYRKYLKRRLTRLEPPYILATLAFFLALIWHADKGTVARLWPSLLASLTYTHNLFFPGELPRINCVLWSLEIEVQFYLLAPAICRGYFLIKQAAIRRTVTLILVGLWAACANQFTGMSLFNFGYFFVAGLVLCDIVCSKGESCRIFRLPVFTLLGAVALCALLWTDFSAPESRFLSAAFPGLIVLFYLIVLLNPFWKRLFSHTLVVVIGGMCYSIYLLHYPLISFVGRHMLPVGINWGFGPYFCLQMIVYITAIVIISSLFYKVVERPCMRKEWPAELLMKYRAMRLRPRRRETVLLKPLN
jgi:peptidoglycan/LPS O-acetylase OafA/YrhL